MTIIPLVEKTMNSNVAYVFLHGAFDTQWSWSYIVDELNSREPHVCLLYSLDEYENIPESIVKYVPKNYTIRLVGFSLGSLVALLLADNISKNHKVELFLVSTPFVGSRLFINSRIYMAKALNRVFFNIKRSYIPLFLRGKLIENKSIELLGLVRSNYDKLISCAENCIHVNVCSGYFDAISGGVKKQKVFSLSFENIGIPSTFHSTGFTSHFPHLIARERLINILLKNES